MDRNCREPGIVKIADLGMARLFNSPLKVRGSYLPPPMSPAPCATMATVYSTSFNPHASIYDFV